MKGYTTENGYMGYVDGNYQLFASEADYREWMEDQRMLCEEKIGLNMGRNIAARDVCWDRGITAWLVQKRLRKILANVDAAIKRVERLGRD